MPDRTPSNTETRELKESLRRIDAMTLDEMENLWNAAPRGEWPFYSWVLGEYFASSMAAKRMLARSPNTETEAC